jgi:hypothetical protein
MYKKKQGRCIQDTADHAAGGGSGRRERGSGRQGAKCRRINQHGGSDLSEKIRISLG